MSARAESDSELDVGSARPCVLVTEDDPAVQRLLVRVLEEAGYDVRTADGALSAAHELELEPDLVLLDLGLPGVDGMEVLARIRRVSDVPVIVVTGRADIGDRVAGLRGGADDYVLKPFEADELVARIETVLRRAGRVVDRALARNGSGAVASPHADDASRALSFPGLVIDCATREILVAGEAVAATAREFDLLAFLARFPRQVFTRAQLLEQVWSSSSEWQDEATVTEHVRRIRRRIEADPDRPRWVQTVRGVGYRFVP